MANEQVTVSQFTTDVLEEEWAPSMHLKANWGRVVTQHFSKPEGVSKPGNVLHLTLLETASAQTLSTSAAAARPDLTYEDDAELNVNVSPTHIYSGLQLTRPVMTRMVRSETYRKGKEKQLRAALATAIDVAGGALVPSLSTNVIGGAGQDLSESLIATGIAKLANSAKEYYNPGKDPAYLIVWPLQIDNVITQPSWTNAQIRGDGQSAYVDGWTWKAFGANLTQSGNLSTSGGVANNLLHIPQSHVLGWWEEITLLEPQASGLVTVVIATATFGVAEWNDEYGVNIQTQTV